MRLLPQEIAQLEKACKGLSPDMVKSIVSFYYKEKLAKLNRPTTKKSFSNKELNKLSQSSEIRELVKGVKI